MMDVTVTKQSLADAVSLAKRAVNRRVTIPQLAHVLIDASDPASGHLVLTATDLSIGVRCATNGTHIAVPGSVTLPADVLSGLVDALPADYVHLSVNDKRVATLDGGAMKATIHGMDPDTFPIVGGDDDAPLGDGEDVVRVEMPTDRWTDLLDKTVFAASQDASRPTLSAVRFALSGGHLEVAATDGYRLSVYRTELADAPDAEALIPASGLHVVGAVVKQLRAESVVIWVSEQKVAVQAVGTGDRRATLFMQTMAGKYPDYWAIVPKHLGTVATLDAEAVVTALRPIRLYAGEDEGRCKIVFVPENGDAEFPEPHVRLEAQSAELGHALHRIPATFTHMAPDVYAVVNIGFLLDVMARMSGKTKIAITQNTRPLVFQPGEMDSTEYLHVLMPMIVAR